LLMIVPLITSTAPPGTFAGRVRRKSCGSPSCGFSVSTRGSLSRRFSACAADLDEDVNRRFFAGKVTPKLRHRAADVQKEVDDLFAQADQDSDGLISLHDLCRMFSHLEGDLFRKAVNVVFWKDVEDDFNYIDKDRFLDVLLVIAKNITENEDDNIALFMKPPADFITEISTILLGGIEKSAPHCGPGYEKDLDAIKRASSVHGRPSGGSHGSRRSSLPRDVNFGRAKDTESSPHERRSSHPSVKRRPSEIGKLSKGLRQTRTHELHDSTQKANYGLCMRAHNPERIGTWPTTLGSLAPPKSVVGNSVAPLLTVAPLTSKHKANTQAIRPLKQQ